MKILLLGGNGYIGSKFYNLYKNKYEIVSVDLCLFEKDLGYSIKCNFDSYVRYNLKEFDCVICLAGHSSVAMAECDKSRSWINNVEYFRNLCDTLTKGQKLIYASSASVYGNTKNGVSSESAQINFNVINHYDLQKITIDLIANKYIAEGKDIVGLRFGTVNGASPNTRSDLMINSMVKSALETGKVNVKNLHIRRAILGINDLVRALDTIIGTTISSGQYNLASFNSSVETMATTIATKINAELVIHENDKLVYDFELDTEKFRQATNFTFTDTIDNLVSELTSTIDSINFDTRSNDRHFKL